MGTTWKVVGGLKALRFDPAVFRHLILIATPGRLFS